MAANDNRADRKRTPREPSNNRANVVALLAVVIVAIALLWTASAIQKHNAVQNCIDSGRHDCVPLPTGPD